MLSFHRPIISKIFSAYSQILIMLSVIAIIYLLLVKLKEISKSVIKKIIKRKEIYHRDSNTKYAIRTFKININKIQLLIKIFCDKGLGKTRKH